MKKRGVKITGIVLVILVGLIVIFAKIKGVSPLSWGHNEVHTEWFSSDAINGFDAVAYFTSNEAIEGNKKYSYHWKNATWNFSTSKNKELFLKYPEKYAPQYGGSCSFAVSQGFSANSDPNSYEIINGKLYLFSDQKVKLTWKEYQQDNILKCEANWVLDSN
jgi:YHS domain-containing protein